MGTTSMMLVVRILLYNGWQADFLYNFPSAVFGNIFCHLFPVLTLLLFKIRNGRTLFKGLQRYESNDTGLHKRGVKYSKWDGISA